MFEGVEIDIIGGKDVVDMGKCSLNNRTDRSKSSN